MAFAAACRGASHQRTPEPTPCQDAYLLRHGRLLGSPFLLAAVADGHGDSRHDRSHFGSRFAVRAAAETMDLCCNSLQLNANFRYTDIKDEFPKLVLRNWYKKVTDHIREQNESIPEEEKEQRRIYSRYGTTLLTVFLWESHFFAAQLGDGDLLLLRDEKAPVWPVARPDNLVGGETYSMTSDSAKFLWRTWYCKDTNFREIPMICLSTDGLRNSYANDAHYLNFLRSLRSNILLHGLDRTIRVVPRYLNKFSENGSGDDITLVCILLTNPETAPGNPTEPETRDALSITSQPANSLYDELGGSDEPENWNDPQDSIEPNLPDHPKETGGRGTGGDLSG